MKMPLFDIALNDLLLPKKRRVFGDDFLKRLTKASCRPFECTAAHDLTVQLAEQGGERLGALIDKMAFLPSTQTWIEYERWPLFRLGWLLTSSERGATVFSAICDLSNGRMLSSKASIKLPLKTAEDFDGFDVDQLRFPDYPVSLQTPIIPEFFSLYYYLAIINSPRVIACREYAADRDLGARLARRLGREGHFQLVGETEIELSVSPPDELSESEGYEPRLVGKKCLHFCRQHIRVRHGQLEWVKAHWRGDAALGVKTSRYRLGEAKKPTIT